MDSGWASVDTCTWPWTLFHHSLLRWNGVTQHQGAVASSLLVLQLPLHRLPEIRIRASDKCEYFTCFAKPLTKPHKSDFRGLKFTCATQVDNTCVCAYPSSKPETCTVSGDDVLNYLDIGSISFGKWAAILVSISVIYRVLWVLFRLLVVYALMRTI